MAIEGLVTWFESHCKDLTGSEQWHPMRALAGENTHGTREGLANQVTWPKSSN